MKQLENLKWFLIVKVYLSYYFFITWATRSLFWMPNSFSVHIQIKNRKFTFKFAACLQIVNHCLARANIASQIKIRHLKLKEKFMQIHAKFIDSQSIKFLSKQCHLVPFVYCKASIVIFIPTPLVWHLTT